MIIKEKIILNLKSILCIFHATFNPRQMSWHACPLFQYLSGKFTRQLPFPSSQFNVVYRNEFVSARFQHFQVRGFTIPVMLLVIVSKIACQRNFVLSDPGVPRTFVRDCKLIEKFRSQKYLLIYYNSVSHGNWLFACIVPANTLVITVYFLQMLRFL